MTGAFPHDLLAKITGAQEDEGEPYPGGVLTDAGISTAFRNAARVIEDASVGVTPNKEMGEGDWYDALDEKVREEKQKLIQVADALRLVADARDEAEPTVRTGKNKQAATIAAVEKSIEGYRSAVSMVGGDPSTVSGGSTWIDVSPDNGGGGQGNGGSGNGGGNGGGGTPGNPRTTTSDGSSTPVQTTGGGGQGGGGTGGGANPSSSSPTSSGQGQGQGGGQGAGQQQAASPAGSPATSLSAGQPQAAGGQPAASTGGGSLSPSELQKIINEEKAKAAGGGVGGGSGAGSNSRDRRSGTDTSGKDGGQVAAAVPVGNPSVTGGPVDPSQTSGRTSSTTSGGTPGAPITNAASRQPMMGGMGGAGLGHVGQAGAQQQAPQHVKGTPKDRESNRVFNGEAAFDKAFSDNVLRDDVSLDVDDRAELADQAQLDAARTEPERSTSPSEAGRIEYDENGRPKFRTRGEAARALALKDGELW